MTVAAEFELARLVLRMRWLECNQSHSKNLEKASKDIKPKRSTTKDQLVKNLIRKMDAFDKILNTLPMISTIITHNKRQAYIDDTEGLTKNMETFILWTWDDQVVADMGFKMVTMW